MAVIRCRRHPPTDEFLEWPAAVEPVGYPDTALVCGHRSHATAEPGLLYLTSGEYRSYQRGRRLFGLAGGSTRVTVSETVYVDDEPRLPRPPAPDRRELAGDFTRSGAAEDTRPGRLRLGVQSYLWSDHWRDALTAQGLTWQAFLSETAPVQATIREWAAGERSWSAVLDEFSKALEMEFRDERR